MQWAPLFFPTLLPGIGSPQHVADRAIRALRPAADPATQRTFGSGRLAVFDEQQASGRPKHATHFVERIEDSRNAAQRPSRHDGVGASEMCERAFKALYFFLGWYGKDSKVFQGSVVDEDLLQPELHYRHSLL